MTVFAVWSGCVCGGEIVAIGIKQNMMYHNNCYWLCGCQPYKVERVRSFNYNYILTVITFVQMVHQLVKIVMDTLQVNVCLRVL